MKWKVELDRSVQKWESDRAGILDDMCAQASEMVSELLGIYKNPLAVYAALTRISAGELPDVPRSLIGQERSIAQSDLSIIGCDLGSARRINGGIIYMTALCDALTKNNPGVSRLVIGSQLEATQKAG